MVICPTFGKVRGARFGGASAAARPRRRVALLRNEAYRVRGKPRSIFDVPGSGHRAVTILARV
jgi:hypothetical protein